MTDAKLAQNSFNGGVWSPILQGRTDFAKHGSAVRRLENFIVWPHGPAQYRPGFKYMAETKTSSVASILIPFEFSVTQAYMIEAGNLYFRFYKNQEQIESAGSPYEIVTPYETADLSELKWCQSADILYLFHPDYNTRKLSRTGHTSWTIAEVNWNPGPMSEQDINPDATLTLDAVTGEDINFTSGSSVFLEGDIGRIITSGVGRASITDLTSGSIAVCDILDDFAAVGPIASGSWAMGGSPNSALTPNIKEPVGAICTITSSNGSEILTDISRLGVNWWAPSGSGTDEYYLLNTATGAYTTTKPGKIYEDNISSVEGTLGSLGVKQWAWGNNDALGYNTIYVRGSAGADPDANPLVSPVKIFQRATLSASSDMFRAADVGKFVRINSGVIKITTYNSADAVRGEILSVLNSISESTSWTLESSMWNSTNGYPRTGTFFEERLMVAGSNAFPETVWGSVVGDYQNHTPGINDSDAVQFSILGRKVNVIRWIEPGDYLIIGTSGSEWRLGPEDTGIPITPLNVVAKQLTTKGCADITPVTIGGSTLFVQRVGRKIRELSFDFAKGETGGYLAPDLTQLAENLTEGGITKFDYQQEPFSTIWTVIDGDNLLGLTYLRDEDVVAWHEHPMTGTDIVEDIAVIPGDGYDEPWAIINRTINGSTARYVECMQKVFTDDAETYAANKGLNAFLVDSGITYNGVSTSTITGLDHLEGKEVAVLADGAVQASKTVSSGEITLDKASTVVHVGLLYTGLIKTLRIDANLEDGTAQGRPKRIVDMVVRVKDSGVFKVGRGEDNLRNIQNPARSLVFGEAPPLFSGDLDTRYEGSFDREGQLFIVQDKPVPLTVQSIYPKTEIND